LRDGKNKVAIDGRLKVRIELGPAVELPLLSSLNLFMLKPLSCATAIDTFWGMKSIFVLLCKKIFFLNGRQWI
jgi:hypothetical protein